MNRIITALVLSTSIAGAQKASHPAKPTAPSTPTSPKVLTLKQTPAVQQLAELDKAFAKDVTDLRAKAEEAHKALETQNKPLEDAIQVKTKPFLDKADEATVDEHKKINENTQKAMADFEKSNAQTENSINTKGAQIDVLVKLVQKEQNLPANVSYDPMTNTWVLNPVTKNVTPVTPAAVPASTPTAK